MTGAFSPATESGIGMLRNGSTWNVVVTRTIFSTRTFSSVAPSLTCQASLDVALYLGKSSQPLVFPLVGDELANRAVGVLCLSITNERRLPQPEIAQSAARALSDAEKEQVESREQEKQYCEKHDHWEVRYACPLAFFKGGSACRSFAERGHAGGERHGCMTAS